MIAARRVFSLFAIVTAFAGGTASAQAPRIEVGGLISTLRLADFAETNLGLGGRASYDLGRWVTLEAEFAFSPHDDVTVSTQPTGPGLNLGYRRRRAEAVFGPKIGVRGNRFGVFGKVRPGFSRLTDRGVSCAGEVCALALIARPIYRTEFALDLGGVFEFYPSARTVARVDLGSLLVRHRSVAPPCWQEPCTSHDFSSRFGFGFRF